MGHPVQPISQHMGTIAQEISSTKARVMISQIDRGFVRETWAIMTLYLGFLLGGFSAGFSAIAIPDMKNEMRYDKTFHR